MQSIEDEAGTTPPNQNSPPVEEFLVDRVKAILEEVQSSDDLFGNVELFEVCASMDDFTYFRAKNMVKEKAKPYKCQTGIEQSLDKHRRKRLKEAADASVKNTVETRTSDIVYFVEDPDSVEVSEMAIKPIQCDYPWVCTKEGVGRPGEDGIPVYFCQQMLFPNCIFHNIESDATKVELLFRNASDGWRFNRIIVDKTLISKASTITELSGRGVDVSSETAKLMVSYLQDVEMVNRRVGRLVPIETTTKFGWGPSGTKYEHVFVPYDKALAFDGVENFKELFQSLQPAGKPEKWLTKIREIRRNECVIPRIAIAASLASALVEPLKITPFITDFWGSTEKGKTVLLMLAASVWADPTLGRYISTFRSTSAGFEVLADALNSLPMILDDSSNASQYLDFEGLIYSLCEGSGKSRSNKALGRQRQMNWRNTILTNGERPLAGKAKQGGAINRVLEIDCNHKKLFKSPRMVCKVIQSNYGYIGPRFIEELKKADQEELIEMFEEILIQLPEESMEKQRQAAACILLADKLADQWIFQDGLALSADEMSEFLEDPSKISEGQRAYEYLSDYVSMNEDKFDPDGGAKYGTLLGKKEPQKGRVLFFRAALAGILEEKRFDLNAFLTWCQINDMLDGQNDTDSRASRIKYIDEDGNSQSKVVKMVCIKMIPTRFPADFG